MIKHFRLVPFIVGCSIGIWLIFYFHAEVPAVVRYPHPDNVESVTYRDKNGVCYKYGVTQVDCNKNEKTLKQYPLQA
jgi:hypothetical protein